MGPVFKLSENIKKKIKKIQLYLKMVRRYLQFLLKNEYVLKRTRIIVQVKKKYKIVLFLLSREIAPRVTLYFRSLLILKIHSWCEKDGVDDRIQSSYVYNNFITTASAFLSVGFLLIFFLLIEYGRRSSPTLFVRLLFSFFFPLLSFLFPRNKICRRTL